MPGLHELQKAFGAAICFGGVDALGEHIVEAGFTAEERLRIYRNTFHAVVCATLRMAYPAVDRLVGHDFFDWAAMQFALAHPPESGYLNEYGGGLADFIGAFPPAQALPYLADVAHFEWALCLAANAPDAPVLDLAALAAVAPDQHRELRFEAHPSVRFLVLGYAADQIADAVMSGDGAAMKQIDLSAAPVHLVVHRGPDGVQAQRLSPDAFRFVSRLCAGEALARLLGTIPVGDTELLAEQFAQGRLTSFRIDPTQERRAVS